MKRNEVLRIYTFVDEKASLPDHKEHKVVFASLPGGSPTRKGMFKFKLGKGDRLVIFDTDHQPILDLDFWWVST